MEIRRVENQGREPRLTVVIQQGKNCSICKSSHQRKDHLCWVCRRLKNSASRLSELDQMGPEE